MIFALRDELHFKSLRIVLMNLNLKKKSNEIINISYFHVLFFEVNQLFYTIKVFPLFTLANISVHNLFIQIIVTIVLRMIKKVSTFYRMIFYVLWSKIVYIAMSLKKVLLF